MRIGNYSLGQRLSEPLLPEVSAVEYAVLPKTFVGEKILKAQDVTFLGHRWNLFLGTVDNRIYKLSPEFTAESGERADAVFSECIEFLSTQFGAPSERVEKVPMIIWDTTFGNVIVGRQSGYGKHYVNLHVTSGEVLRAATPIATGRKSVISDDPPTTDPDSSSTLTWDPRKHSDEDNLRWAWLRAVEWERWPVFLSQPLVPLLLIWLGWRSVVYGTGILGIIWATFVAYRFVNVRAAFLGACFVRLKWLTWPASAIYLFVHRTRPEWWIAAIWPLLAGIIGASWNTARIGRIQSSFMRALGYQNPEASTSAQDPGSPTLRQP